VEEVARHLEALSRGQAYRASDVDLAHAAEYSAACLSRRLADLFNRVAA